MITLVTGTPGAGKTLWVVRELVSRLVSSGRDIYTNIEGLNLQAANVYSIQSHELHFWESYPDGAIFLFDECQEMFPPRHATAKVPSYISAFQTHRHRGMDFYLITQEPSLIDKSVRVLVGRHVHLYRPMGLKRAQVFEWATVNPDPNPTHTHSTAKRNQFIFPKALYAVYKSASSHTHSLNLPWSLIITILSSILFLSLCAWWFFQSTFLNAADRSLHQSSSSDSSVLGEALPSEAFPLSSCFFVGRLGHLYLIRQDSGHLFAISDVQSLELCHTMN